jgi:hypothetical protein
MKKPHLLLRINIELPCRDSWHRLFGTRTMLALVLPRKGSPAVYFAGLC